MAGVAAVRPGIAAAADSVAGLHRGIAEAEAVARAHGFVIAPDGRVTDPNPPTVRADQVALVARERAATMTEILDRVEQVLRRAAEIGDALAGVLRRADTDQIDDGSGDTLVGAATMGAAAAEQGAPGPPPGGPPTDNAGWWSALSDGERARIVAEHPEWIGNLDGVPAAARHEANLARLPGEIARVDGELTAARAELDQALATEASWPDGLPGASIGSVELQDRVDALAARRADLAEIDRIVDRDDRRLIAFDTSGRHVTAAVAQGDIDTAAHVAVFTPGFTTTARDSLDGYDQALRQVQQRAQGIAEMARSGDSVATVAWLGYQAPQWDEVVEPGRSVFTTGAARAGAEQLTGLLHGFEATRTDDYHLTALGHSYGSLTTGIALHDTIGVDDAVLFGSPGIGTVFNVTPLQVPDGHTFVTEAADDRLVADAGIFGTDPDHLGGVTVLTTDDAVDPDSGEPLRANRGHGAGAHPTDPTYLTTDTTAGYNIAAVVAGARPDQLIIDTVHPLGPRHSRATPDRTLMNHTTRTLGAAATAATLAVLLACGGPPAMPGPTPEQQRAELAARPDIDTASAQLDVLLAEYRDRLQTELGLDGWGDPDQGGTNACARYLAVHEALQNNISGWSRDGGVPEQGWPHALRILTEITGRAGFDPPVTLIDRPGSTHVVILSRPDGAAVRLYSYLRTVIGATTGCHLPAPGA